jgi:hypothetical protein
LIEGIESLADEFATYPTAYEVPEGGYDNAL